MPYYTENANVVIRIPERVRDKLGKLKRGHETYGDVILRLMTGDLEAAGAQT